MKGKRTPLTPAEIEAGHTRFADTPRAKELQRERMRAWRKRNPKRKPSPEAHARRQLVARETRKSPEYKAKRNAYERGRRAELTALRAEVARLRRALKLKLSREALADLGQADE